jgi:hypothetical protein
MYPASIYHHIGRSGHASEDSSMKSIVYLERSSRTWSIAQRTTFSHSSTALLPASTPCPFYHQYCTSTQSPDFSLRSRLLKTQTWTWTHRFVPHSSRCPHASSLPNPIPQIRSFGLASTNSFPLVSINVLSAFPSLSCPNLR